jgi:hypothetical protein
LGSSFSKLFRNLQGGRDRSPRLYLDYPFKRYHHRLARHLNLFPSFLL